MTTFNTGNPLGSTDPRDLYDNAQNLDELTNSQSKLSHPDRRGVSRKTWHGMEEEFDGDQARREDDFQAAQDDKQDRFNAFIAASGYEFIGDYASGIEVTEYNQVVRDADGEFWRASGSTELPYTASGAGLPEGGAFVSVGDAVLRQDLVQPVATFNNVADMKNAGGLPVGRKVRTLGYYSPGDGGGNDYEIVAAGTGSNYGFLYEQLAGSGLVAKLLGGGIMEDKTAYIPTDYPTLQEAIDDLSKLRVTQGVTIDLMIEAGHQPASGILVENGDYRHFQVSSEDMEVLIGTDYQDSYFIYARNSASAPTLNCLIDAGGNISTGYQLFSNCDGRVTPGSGVKRVTSAGLYVYTASKCDAVGTVWSDCSGKALRISRASTVNCPDSDFSNSGDQYECVYVNRSSTANLQSCNFNGTPSEYAISAGRSSVVNAHYLSSNTVSGGFANAARNSVVSLGAAEGVGDVVITCGGIFANAVVNSSIVIDPGLIAESSSGSAPGIYCNHNGEASMTSGELVGFSEGIVADRASSVSFVGDISSCVSHGIRAERSSYISMTGEITGSGAIGAWSRRGSSIGIRGSSVTGSAGNDLVVSEGSFINANGTSTTNGSGSPNIGDTGQIGGFNIDSANGNRGIIWTN